MTNRSLYSKDQFGKVLVCGTVQKVPSQLIPAEVIATLPIGYRPEIDIVAPCAYYATDGVYIVGLITISADGAMLAKFSQKENVRFAYLNFTFLSKR